MKVVTKYEFYLAGTSIIVTFTKYTEKRVLDRNMLPLATMHCELLLDERTGNPATICVPVVEHKD